MNRWNQVKCQGLQNDPQVMAMLNEMRRETIHLEEMVQEVCDIKFPSEWRCVILVCVSKFQSETEIGMVPTYTAHCYSIHTRVRFGMS